MITDAELAEAFPALQNYTVTSAPTPRYNCIAWAAGDHRRWWWPPDSDTPEAYWPPGVRRDCTLEAFIAAYRTVGFTPCASGEHEPGYVKVAIYVNADGRPEHAARQVETGKWTSKLGQEMDIEHELLELEGPAYGRVGQFLRKPIGPPRLTRMHRTTKAARRSRRGK